MENAHKIGLGLFALAMGAAVLAMQPEPARESADAASAAAQHLTLAKVAPNQRRDVDYRAFDQRLNQLVSEPGMVGLAVGIVENGRITFLKGYGETEAGSGEPVTPATVFRWASVSKGVASTMVAKLAEEGKVDLAAPLVNYAPGLKLPGRYEYRASVGDLLSHRVGLYRNAYDNKLEEGRRPATCCGAGLPSSTRSVRPGPAGPTRTSPMTRRARSSSGRPARRFAEAVRDKLFAPIGMTSASMSMPELAGEQELGAAARRGQKAAADDRHLLQGAGGGRGQQQHQGHEPVDAGADGRDAGRAEPAPACPQSTRLWSRRRASAGGCATSSSGSGRPGTAMAGAAMIMPGTASSGTAAGSTAIAR